MNSTSIRLVLRKLFPTSALTVLAALAMGVFIYALFVMWFFLRALRNAHNLVPKSIYVPAIVEQVINATLTLLIALVCIRVLIHRYRSTFKSRTEGKEDRGV
jgi:hypothetical protein